MGKMRQSEKEVEYWIIVPGRAYSGNCKSKRKYQETIYKQASTQIETPFECDGLEVKVDYFLTNPRNRIDTDNLSKTVLDGLKGIAYLDDAQVETCHSTVHDMRASVTSDEPHCPEFLNPTRPSGDYVGILVRKRPKLIIKTT